MAQQVKDSFVDLERHRQLLEKTIEKLQKALKEWRTWEAEYEGLTEEIQAITPPASREQLITIGREYEGELLKQTELEDIIGIKIPRSADQVTNILQRRIDYVGQNVQTLEKQLEAAVNKLTTVSIVSRPDILNDDGLPLTEIFEELDEDGNVISSHTSTPGSSKGQLLEVLQKAGIKDLHEGAKTEPSTVYQPVNKSTKFTTKEEQPAEGIPRSLKKGVKFTEDTKAGPETEKSQTSKRIDVITELSKQRLTGPPVIPVGESPEDAALRKEMLEYNMAEVGVVVAELDLEEDSEFDDEYDDDDETSTGDEDEYGRFTGPVVDEKMRKRMIELEQKLGVRMMQNAGPGVEVGILNEGIASATVEQANQDTEASEPEAKPWEHKVKSKKGVRFSKELDIQDSLDPVPAAKISDSNPPISKNPPVSDIVERVTPVQVSSVNAIPSQNSSKIKGPRAAKPPALAKFPPPSTLRESSRTRLVPTGPPGKSLADRVVERDVEDVVPVELDEFDPTLLHQEVAMEYHRTRNRMIQRQGGFMKEEEDETCIIPFDEEEGGPKKMSRFMAARLAKGGRLH